LALSYAAIAPAILISDLLSILVASVGTGVAYQLLFYGTIGRVQEFLSLAVLVGALVIPVLHLRGHYQARELLVDRTQVLDIASTWIVVFVFLSALALGLKVGALFPKAWIYLFFVAGICILIGQRLIWETRLVWAVARGIIGAKNVALIGSPSALEHAAVEEGLNRVGVRVTRKIPLATVPEERITVSSHFGEAIQTELGPALRSLRGSDLDEIFIVGGWSDWLYIRKDLNVLRAACFPVRLVPDANLADLVARPAVYLGVLPALELQGAPLSSVELALKRIIDVALSSLAIVILSPIMTVVALAIRLESPGRILFRQTRNGFNGRPFQIYKFRTMHVMEDGPSIRPATRGDPRVTKIGRFLRRTSMDELPQLLNVLKGEMSVIGPRPHAVAHDEHYDVRVARYAHRQRVKPGITGWAQVHGCRGEISSVEAMEDRVRLDLWYIANWSPWLDLRIMMLTLVSLVTNRNVY
jgi:putative colanic acid biosynthesis UDP-glucose lipid carrier transferase